MWAAVPGQAEEKQAGDKKTQAVPGPVEALLDGMTLPPVSYTHLDVYKRQAFWC